MSSSYINVMTVSLTTVVLSSIFLLTTVGPANLLKRAQRTKYAYEVTLALYMLTPTERFIFNSILFLALSLLLIAAFLYLPEHIATISRRAFYYCFGDDHVHYSAHVAGDAARRTVQVAKATMGAMGLGGVS